MCHFWMQVIIKYWKIENNARHLIQQQGITRSKIIIFSDLVILMKTSVWILLNI